MKMVDADPAVVEARLAAGAYSCASCGSGRLRPWGFARHRVLRRYGEPVRLRPRRSRCGSCAITHVLLPTFALLRRRDLAEVIGEALFARFVRHDSRADVAKASGVPHPDTVRGWCRRFRSNAAGLRASFTTLAHELDPNLGPLEDRGSPEADALEAIGTAAVAAARRFGPAPVWQFVSGATGGRLLANTNCPLPGAA